MGHSQTAIVNISGQGAPALLGHGKRNYLMMKAMPMRPNNRSLDHLRNVTLEAGASKYAEGSCLAKFGDTHVLCTASVDENVPRWMKGKGKGWVTGEYGMLPRSTHTRNNREAARGKQGGRTVEIQRLIGRSLRAAVDLKKLGERQIIVDCDVMQADANFVLTQSGGVIEVQASAEDTPFTADEMAELMRLAVKGIGELCEMQAHAVGKAVKGA